MTVKIQAMLDWSPDEKAAKAKEWAQSLFTLRLQKATGQLENPMKIRELRKERGEDRTRRSRNARLRHLPQHLDPGRVGPAALGFVGASGKSLPALRASGSPEIEKEARLPEAGLAGHHADLDFSDGGGP